MKRTYKKFGILALIFTAMCSASTPSFAAGDHDEKSEHQAEEGHHEGGHEAKALMPKTEKEIVSKLFSTDLHIQNFIKTGKLTKIHEPAYEAKSLIEALVKLNKSNPKSTSATKKIAKLSKKIGASAKLLDKYGDAKNVPKTRSAYKAFASAIIELKAIYPKVKPEHYWTCSMHPEIWSATSGPCPKCKMKLVEKGKAHEEHDDSDAHSDGHKKEHKDGDDHGH